VEPFELIPLADSFPFCPFYDPIDPMSEPVQPSPPLAFEALKTRIQDLEAENQRLRALMANYQQLQQEKQDLHLTLLTAIEHGDTIEAELQHTNQHLRQEIVERHRAEMSLYTLLDFVRSQYADLQIMLDILTEHGDVLDQQWSAKINYISHLATVDPLTQLANRRKLDDYLDQCWHDLGKTPKSLGILLCDIDFFKEYNDTYGHPQGDNCLQEVAACLTAVVPTQQGLVARYGGEEFAVVLPCTEIQTAVQLATTIVQRVAQLQIPHTASTVAPYVTLSIGLATVIPTADIHPQSLIDAADKQLYLAKNQGKNCVCYPNELL